MAGINRERMIRWAGFVWILLLALGFSTGAQAAQFCVSTSVELYNALQTAAKNGEDDIIRIVQGTYVGNYYYFSTEPNSLTLEGGYEPGCTSRTVDPTNTILDGNGFRILAVSTDKPTALKAEGLTFQKGVVANTEGGGLYFKTSDGTLTVDTCSFIANSALAGGGVYAEESSSLTFTNNTFTGNSALFKSSSSGGGGVYAYGSTVTFTGNTFTGNSAAGTYGSGGGGYVYGSSGSTLTFTGNTFTHNSAAAGGGLLSHGYSTLTFANNTFSGNLARGNPASGYIGSGGGVDAYGSILGSTLTFANNTFRGNATSDYCGEGGGVDARGCYSALTFTGNTFTGNSATGTYGTGGGARVYCSDSTLTFTNNTFDANEVTEKGGGLYALSSTLILTNNTFYDNKAMKEGGGGIRVQMDKAHIYNNIFWMNTSPEGADLFIYNNDGGFFPLPVELFNNDFDQSAAGTYIKLPFPIDPSNLDKADPLFVDAASGDLHLSPGSPCIDAGDNNAPELPAADKDGSPRIFGGTVDMGAYEYQEVLYVEPEGVCGGKTPCYSSIHEALASSGSSAIIKIAEGAFNEDLALNQAKILTLQGGWNSTFTTQSSYTTVTSMTISDGTIVPDRMVLK